MSNKLDSFVNAYKGQIYDFDNELILSWYANRIIQSCASSMSLLELGLGHGFTTNIFNNHFTDHTVLDGSQEVINNFQEKFPDCKAKIIKTYFEDYESKEKYDVIVLGFILEHVDEPEKILNKYKTFLKPGGRLFVTVPNAEAMNRRLGHYAGLLADMNELSQNDLVLGHKRYFTVDSLKESMGNAGISIERIEGIYLKPLTTSQILSLNLDRKIIEGLCDIGINYPELSCGILAEGKVK